jgi:Transposase DDE domain
MNRFSVFCRHIGISMRGGGNMLLSKIFLPFVEKRPVCVMARGILERLFDPARLNALFAETAQVGYTHKLHFATLVGLMGDVVLGVQPSVHAAFQALEETEATVSLTAIYNKLDRVEPVVSAALVRDAAQQTAPVIDALSARLPPWLPGYRCRILDGNHLSATEHRIEELRTTWAAPLPGKVLVVLDQERMLADEVFLTEDGHAQERSLLDTTLEKVKANDLWLGDRNFCTFKFLFGIARRGGYFLIRQHGTVHGRLLGRRRKIGRGPTGMVYEQALELTDSKTGETVTYRRLTVKLDQATRDGDWQLHLLSNVAESDADASTLANLYAKRWTIETVFQEITATLQCEIQTLGYPKAALFAFCLALVAFNAVSLLKAALRAVHGEATVTDRVSGYYLNLEIRGTYDGMMIAIPERHWKTFRMLSIKELANVLKEVAGHLRLSRYQKHRRGPKKPPPKKSAYANGGHVSTFRLLNRNE